MPTEIEAKMRIGDPATVAALLREAGAAPLGEVLERNEFFDTAGNDLYRAGRGLRLRTSIDIAGGRRRSAITHKGPRQPGELKVREEIEVGVDDPDSARELLERLGLRRTLLFEKRRQSWRLDNCRVEIDELPHLGFFVEIEGPDEASIMEIRHRLMLAGSPLITKSYAHLVAEHLAATGQRAREMRFA